MRHLGVSILKTAARLLVSYVNRTSLSTSSLRFKLFHPSAFADPKALFFTFLWKKRPVIFALIPGSHTLGFGYPLDASFNFQTLGSLFQPPTLLGFSLQSFPPPK
jgi:hypothetical protein